MRKPNRKSARMIPGLLLALVALSFAPVQAGQAPAPAAPSLESALKELAAFDGGLNSDAFWKVRSLVLAAKNAPDARRACEAKLLVFLDTKATLVAKDAVCRMLRIIGGDASVAVLQRMLAVPETTDMARYALEKIPGDAAEAALLEALGKTPRALKLGVISSLADRKSVQAVAPLGTLVPGPNADVAAAATIALGRIGGKDAADVLGKSLASAAPALKETIASSLILCADGFLAQKDLPAAAAIYDRLLSEKLPVSIRRAAMRGKIMAAGDKASNLILATLAGPDADLQLPAIELVKTNFANASIAPVCAALPALFPANQVALIAVLSEYQGNLVTAALTQAARSDRKEVRLAALKAFEKAGDGSNVGLLAEAAASGPADEKAAARTSLWGMKGKPVDQAVLALLAGTPGEGVQSELVQSVGERRIFAEKSVVAKFTDAPSAKVREAAVKAIRMIGTPSDIPGLLNVLLKTEDETEQIGIETAIAGLALKIGQPEGRANAVKDRLAAEKDAPNRAVLIRLLGKIGDNSTLPQIRQGLADGNARVADAAARALAAWPTATAKDDVLLLARTSKNPTHQVLALQAYIRLTLADKYRKPEEAVKDLKLALDLAARPEEKKLVLGGLPDFAGPEALKLAESQIAAAGVQEEAKTAVKKIQDKMTPAR
jgi:HEAT repeat protein